MHICSTTNVGSDEHTHYLYKVLPAHAKDGSEADRQLEPASQAEVEVV